MVQDQDHGEDTHQGIRQHHQNAQEDNRDASDTVQGTHLQTDHSGYRTQERGLQQGGTKSLQLHIHWRKR